MSEGVGAGVRDLGLQLQDEQRIQDQQKTAAQVRTGRVCKETRGVVMP